MSALGEGLHPWRPGTAANDTPWVALDWCDPHEGRLLAADSWRVVEGRVRGLEAHRARFLAAVGPWRDDAETFWRDAVAALPRSGDWFPRVELRERAEGTQLSLRLRPTPATGTEVDVATAPHDPRTRPLIKGPDLDALQALRVAVQPSGAGEAIIVDAQGRVVEGAYSGLLWWRGETLVRPADALPRIPSVTVDLVVRAARAAGVPLAEAEARPADLAGCELWVLSALHGLRSARHWIDGPALAPATRAPLGRAWLAGAAVDLYPDRGTPALGG
ncbi:aminotransferase class IV [Microcella humidisoli]|uniref:Aminotransferase class IV n=1 Tax=Microcella humidisoli TaxID=2963406 RepID=A0ABY5FWP2_9MICO|nr:aminotransferase class IV [Microcella humidisoli]UTT62561.1 aminotransferase class IV [Microcella humidisoli]